MAKNLPATTYDEFLPRLKNLVEKFRRNLRAHCEAGYSEAQLRSDFLDDFWLALGWDLTNDLNLIGPHREVEIESPTMVATRRKKADYLFRADRIPRFTSEAKRPALEFSKLDVFQAKRYAWAKDLPLAVLTSFNETRFFLVGAEPDINQPRLGLCRSYRFDQLVEKAEEVWGVLSRSAVASGSIEAFIASESKGILSRGPRQAWLFRPDRNKALDASFLAFLDDARRRLAESLLAENPAAKLDADYQLNEAVQRILDRLVFLRICEDRDIDIGTILGTLLQTWENTAHKNKRVPEPLYAILVRHLRQLDHRQEPNTPFFNGQLFKPHFSENLKVGDTFLQWFLDKLTSDDSPYQFSAIPVDILGSVYERFLGKVIEIHNAKVALVDSPSARKAEGVFYTPVYVSHHIIERTVGALIQGKKPEELQKLRIIDPACGSGSFLIRAYERIIEHYLEFFTKHKKHRLIKQYCYVDSQKNLQLTTETKRVILSQNIFGVDLDQQAVEVTQLSLYLKLLEGETRHTLNQQKTLFDEKALKPLLPPLDANIRHGNSIIEPDSSLSTDIYFSHHPKDMRVLFNEIMTEGGFDAVVGNPPYIPIEKMSLEERAYYSKRYSCLERKYDTSVIFTLRGLELLKPSGLLGYISSVAWQTGENYGKLRKATLGNRGLVEIINLPFDTFADAYVDAGVFIISKEPQPHYGIYRFPKKERIVALNNAPLTQVPASLINEPDYRIVLDPIAHAILARAKKAGFAELGDLTDSTQGLAANRFSASAQRESANWFRFDAKANAYRYSLSLSQPALFTDMSSFLSLKRFYVATPKLLFRRLVNRQDRLDIAYTDIECVFKKDINPFVVTTTRVQPRYLLGVLNSKLISYLYVNTSSIAMKDDFRQTTLAELRRIPVPLPDADSKSGNAIQLKVEKNALKIEELTSRISGVREGSPAASTIRDALLSLESEIDNLVYGLFDLSPKEINVINEAYSKNGIS